MKKRYNIITVILLIYLAIMAYIGRDLIISEEKYFEFFSLIGVTLLVILLLRISLKKRDNKNNFDEE